MPSAQSEPPVVLVVEDEFLIHELIVPALEEAGYRSVTTTEGNEAVVLLKNQEHTIRALVTDVHLGEGINGWDVARRAREIYQDIPVVYMTGRGAHEWTAQGVPNSILVAKPFAPDQIVSAVSQLLNATPPTVS